MRKSILFLILSIVLVLAACGKDSGNNSSDDKSSNTKDTVKIVNNYKARGEKQDGSDAKTIKDTVEVPKNPKRAVVFDYAAVDLMKAFGVQDTIKALPKGEGVSSVPQFLSEFKDDKYINTGKMKEVNFDRVAQAKPDVIYISGRTASQKNLDEFKKAAPNAKIVYVGSSEKNYLQDMKKVTTDLGKIYGKEDKAKALNDELDKKNCRYEKTYSKNR